MKISTSTKDRMLGTAGAILVSAFLFLVNSFFGSLQTKADTDKRFRKVESQLKIILCLQSKAYCDEEAKLIMEAYGN